MPSLYTVAIPPLLRGLKNISAILTYAREYAQKNNVDLQDYLDGRLYPDMANLPYQVYRFTDNARFIAVRIAGAEPLSQPDVEKTFPELQTRITQAIKYLEALKKEDFEGKDDKEIVLNPSGPNGTKLEIKMSAVDYLTNYALPQFWFHITVAYGILRMKGVDVGKAHFLNAAGEVKFGVAPVQKDEGARG